MKLWYCWRWCEYLWPYKSSNFICSQLIVHADVLWQTQTAWNSKRRDCKRFTFIIHHLFIKNPYFPIFSTSPSKVPPKVTKRPKPPPKQKKNPNQPTKAYFHLVGFGGIFEADTANKINRWNYVYSFSSIPVNAVQTSHLLGFEVSEITQRTKFGVMWKDQKNIIICWFSLAGLGKLMF